MRFAVEYVDHSRFLIWKLRCAQDDLLYHFAKFQEHRQIFKDVRANVKLWESETLVFFSTSKSTTSPRILNETCQKLSDFESLIKMPCVPCVHNKQYGK